MNRLKDKIALIQRANEAAYDYDERVRQVQIGFVDSKREILIANSDGIYIGDVQPMLSFQVVVVATEGNITQVGTHGGGGRIGPKRKR